MSLHDLPIERISSACIDLMKRSEFFPRPSDIRSAAEINSGKKIHNAGCGACTDVRDYSDYFHGLHKSRLKKLVAGKAKCENERELEAVRLVRKHRPEWFQEENHERK